MKARQVLLRVLVHCQLRREYLVKSGGAAMPTMLIPARTTDRDSTDPARGALLASFRLPSLCLNGHMVEYRRPFQVPLSWRKLLSDNLSLSA